MPAPDRKGRSVRPERMNRLLREWVHDTYKSKHKLPEPTVCPNCGAVYQKGRWQWAPAPDGASEGTCAACQRCEDNVPAGYLSLKGEFLSKHRDEIINLIRNVEEKERSEHPLKRIMAIAEDQDGMLITFTDPHLARGTGEALYSAFKGELEFSYQEENNLLRVFWSR